MNGATTAVLVAALALAGCAGPPLSPVDQAELDRPIVCASKAQCDAMWQRAQVFVTRNSVFRVQSSTDAVITTFGPTEFGGHAGDIAWTITRLSNASGGAVIESRVGCAMSFCLIDPWRARLAFRRFVVS